MAETNSNQRKVDPFNRAEVHAKTMMEELSAYIRPVHANLLEYLFLHEMQYVKISTLIREMYPNGICPPYGAKIKIETDKRDSLQNAFSVIRRLIQPYGYEIRTLQLPNDRRIRAYGIFPIRYPDNQEFYKNVLKLDSFEVGYQP